MFLAVPGIFLFSVTVDHVYKLLSPFLCIDGFSILALKFTLGLARALEIYYFTGPE